MNTGCSSCRFVDSFFIVSHQTTQNLAAMEELLGKGSTTKNERETLRRRNMLPFTAFEEVPTADDDEETPERPFLMCPQNRSDNTYRSPWTNMYYAFEQKGGEEEIKIYARDIPDDEKEIRTLELNANDVWEAYTRMYYGAEAVCSVYLKSLGDPSPGSKSKLGPFEGMFGIKKSAGNGAWDSLHLVKVDQPNEKDKTCEYHVESQVVVTLHPYKDSDVSSFLTKETSRQGKVELHSLNGSHLTNLGKIMEDVEIEFRSKMERVDMPKTTEVIQSIHRKTRQGSTAHLFTGGDAGLEPSMASGMGLAAGMIGEIANKAKAKRGGAVAGGGGGAANPFMEAMKKNETFKRASSHKDDAGGSTYTDMKSALKKGSPAAPAQKTLAGVGGASPAFSDMKKTLKKSGGAPATKQTEAPAAAPEFADFRSRLKKTGR